MADPVAEAEAVRETEEPLPTTEALVGLVMATAGPTMFTLMAGVFTTVPLESVTRAAIVVTPEMDGVQDAV